jgi:hypothetical protein
MHRRLRVVSAEHGAGTLEYLGVVIVASVLVTALITSGIIPAVPDAVKQAICKIGPNGGGCGGGGDGDGGAGGEPANVQAGGTPPAPSPGQADNPDREDTARDAREDRRNRGRGDETQPNDGTPGQPTPTSPLGEPVPGESVPDPDPPAWQPSDEGAGEHGSKGAGLNDHFTKFAAEAAANTMGRSWPDASRNLLHFLGNSGDPLEQDVDKMLDDVSEFQDTVDDDQTSLGLTAVEEAKRRGASGPLTFPVNTAWTGFGYDETGALEYDNDNWFYALGGWQYNLTGEVTVYPPATPGGQWRYEVTTRVNVRDQYNWDGTKSTQIGPFTVDDETLAELHRKGLAQEYSVRGRSERSTREGSVP